MYRRKESNKINEENISPGRRSSGEGNKDKVDGPDSSSLNIPHNLSFQKAKPRAAKQDSSDSEEEFVSKLRPGNFSGLATDSLYLHSNLKKERDGKMTRESEQNSSRNNSSERKRYVEKSPVDDDVLPDSPEDRQIRHIARNRSNSSRSSSFTSLRPVPSGGFIPKDISRTSSGIVPIGGAGSRKPSDESLSALGRHNIDRSDLYDRPITNATGNGRTNENNWAKAKSSGATDRNDANTEHEVRGVIGKRATSSHANSSGWSSARPPSTNPPRAVHGENDSAEKQSDAGPMKQISVKYIDSEEDEEDDKGYVYDPQKKDKTAARTTTTAASATSTSDYQELDAQVETDRSAVKVWSRFDDEKMNELKLGAEKVGDDLTGDDEVPVVELDDDSALRPKGAGKKKHGSKNSKEKTGSAPQTAWTSATTAADNLNQQQQMMTNAMSFSISKVSFVLYAHSRGAKSVHVQCTIIRDRSSLQGKIYPLYDLVLEEPRKVLIRAQKMSMNRTSNYHLFDMTRGHVGKLSKKSGNYLGKLRAKNTKRTGYALMNHNMDKEEVMAVLFEDVSVLDQWRDGYQPRKMKILLPILDANGVPVPSSVGTHQRGLESMFDVLQNVEETKMEMPSNFGLYQTKEPVFEGGNYRLNFHGRVNLPSVKNFQIVPVNDIDDVICQFGKVEKDEFHLDFKAPLNAFQAFALALCQFNL